MTCIFIFAVGVKRTISTPHNNCIKYAAQRLIRAFIGDMCTEVFNSKRLVVNKLQMHYFKLFILLIQLGLLIGKF